MIHSYTACTYEIDYVELAVSEVMQQLDLEGKLLKNSIGILTCFSDFIDSGVVKALYEQLPFDIIGITTIANAASTEANETLLSLLILTSDDVSFSTGLTDPIVDEDESLLRTTYERAASSLPDKPSLMFSFAPMIYDMGGDFYSESLNKISGGIPNFGTLAVDHTEGYTYAQVIYNGQGYSDCFALLLISGEIDPKFYMGTISDEKILFEKGVVTAAKRNQLQSINGIPAVDYFISLGFSVNEERTHFLLLSCPIIIDYNDGTEPVIRTMFAITPEGHVVCGADIPVGATVSVAEFNATEIKHTSSATLEKAIAERNQGTYLIYSCIGRYFAQGSNQLQEVEAIQKRLLQAGIPYLFAYSGCEFCPVHSNDGTLTNRIHNNTIIICSF